MQRTLNQNKRIWKLKSDRGIKEDHFRDLVWQASGGRSRSTRDLTVVQARTLIQYLENEPRKHVRKSNSPYASKTMITMLKDLGHQYPWKSPMGFRAFLAEKFQIKSLEDKVDRKSCHAAIEALKQMINRENHA